MLLQGKTALITGGASGIGRAAALLFAREGAKVTIADRDVDGGQEAASAITSAGGKAIFVEADVTSETAVAAMVAATVEAFGGLDVAFNNAGGPGRYANETELDVLAYRRIVDLNMTSTWLCMKYEIPAMLARGGGAIVNNASRNAQAAAPNLFAYNSTKAAIVGMTRSAAVDHAADNIRVNALLPGFTLTPMVEQALKGKGLIAAGNIEARIPMRRMGTSEEQAEAALWLCSDRASFVTGTTLVVDGGHSAAL
ncbi:SDR family NAD(P)-dependent oxidoreductase [Sphingosinicella terrae]|uniref:SDR family NAD(P)-dependent oxidoreductase n=1 Tax=Sphingosinicella terrae TaxID=2172047 RepID=UPI000E0D4B4B|nr:glucose 1-dehydrogenase [Sphingosinicella terrae]